MKVFIIGLISLFFATSTNACEPTEITFNKNKICASLKWMTGPTLNEFNSIEVSLRREGHLGLENTMLKVLPWMVMGGGHEHGSRPVETSKVGNDLYLVKKIYFMGGMSGNWFLRFQLLDNNSQIIEEVRSPVVF